MCNSNIVFNSITSHIIVINNLTGFNRPVGRGGGGGVQMLLIIRISIKKEKKNMMLVSRNFRSIWGILVWIISSIKKSHIILKISTKIYNNKKENKKCKFYSRIKRKGIRKKRGEINF